MSKIEKIKMENGLTLYLYEDKRRHAAFVNLVTQFGGIHHDFTLNGKKQHIPSGVAHFLEHYLLEHTMYGSLINKLKSMYLSANGVTSLNKTEYYFSGVTNIEKALEMLIKAVHNIHFIKEKIEETKKAIYEEIRMGEDNKGRRLFKMQNELLLKNIPYRNTIGTNEDLKKIDVSLATLCYEAFYRPENEYLFIAGNFDRDKILKIVKKSYQNIRPVKGTFKIKKYKEPKGIKKEKEIIHMPTAEDILTITYKLDVSKLKPKEKLKLDFYLSYFLKMNIGRTSELSKKLEQNKIIIGSVSYDHIFIENICIVSIKATIVKEKEFVKEITKQIAHPIFKEELFKLYQRDTTLEVAARCEYIYRMINPLIENIFTFSYEKRDTVKQIKSYSYEDFQNIMKSFSFDEYAICKIAKKVEKNEEAIDIYK